MSNKIISISNTQKNSFATREEEILDFWDSADTFRKSVDKDASYGDYVFYDGPPFGTGEPHYGHLLSSIAKDVVPRYWTMQGFRVERRWGWDCHGLPIENIIEKDLGINGKKQIEELGIAKFNEACRARVLEYADIWEVMIRRIARWVDFKNSYKTMDATYMESVWWAFKQLWQKDLIYEGRRVLLYCPRCETPISNFEVAMDNSYQDITEESVYVKFKQTKESVIKNQILKQVQDDNVYILAWTTTPWTLPGNVALAVGKDIDYVLIKAGSKKLEVRSSNYEYFILAKERLSVIKNKYEIVEEFKGRELIGLEYEPLFDVPLLKNSGKKVYYVADADFVTVEDGTGVVHTAVVYGEEDYELGLKLDLPIIPALDEKGYFNETVPQFKGVYFRDADRMIIADLDRRGLLFATEQITHSYPFCWRCDTQLFYNAIPAWFLAISKIRQRMLDLNERINWFPANLKHGRFALGIEQAPDWNISRNRYFATPIPIWQCTKCQETEIIGSITELTAKGGKNDITDIHSHFIDDITWPCSKCGGEMKRIKEVFDCWVESGSMSFAQLHYPFENKDKFEKNFPAQYISEYISQTRAWFYVMHVVSTALFNSNSFENVIATGVIFNAKGEKMSKSRKNFPDPYKVINEFGADSLRFYLMSSPLMQAENLFFNERELRDVFRKNIMLLWHVYKFYEMYEDKSKVISQKSKVESDNVLDKWILSRLHQLINEVTENMNKYDLPRAARPITDFINDLSTWYLRRSRERFKGEDANDKQRAFTTTGFILQELAKVIAPFMPFIAEEIWQKVIGHNFNMADKSVHLEAWPEAGGIDEKLIADMAEVRKIVELGLAARDEAGIKVRQPLSKFSILNPAYRQAGFQFSIKEYEELIKEELNVKEIVVIGGNGEIKVKLDTDISDELKLEGLKRELVRQINALRKEAGLTIADRIILSWQSDSKLIQQVFVKMSEVIKKDTLSGDIKNNLSNTEINKEVEVNKEKVTLGLLKK